jgi:hypothetical protein
VVKEDSDMAEVIDVPLTRAAAVNLYHWLQVVPEAVIPVTHPAERQALADLLTQLEMCAPTPTDAALREAREALLANAGEWVNEGPIYDGNSRD